MFRHKATENSLLFPFSNKHSDVITDLHLISVNETMTTSNDTLSVTTVSMVEHPGEILNQIILQTNLNFRKYIYYLDLGKVLTLHTWLMC